MRKLLLLTVLLFAVSTAPTYAAEKSSAEQATPVDRIKLPPGFKAELLYSVPKSQGSWVAIASDNKGRLITSDQSGKLYRVTPAKAGRKTQVEPIDLDIGMAHGLLYAFDSLYVMVNGKGSGLYRVTDTDGDDKYDTVKQLIKMAGAGEHGPHAVILSPDKKSLYICAGNHTNLPPITKSRVPRNWQEDQLLPRMWDARGHARGKLAPGGWVCRTDPEGKELELVSMGYRNEFDIAFSDMGELFTYDADMEWDVGSPWYRPTRVNHVTSGSEFGWRSGTGKWPAYYPDSLPAVVDIGPGSPTGIMFGTGAKFPAKYQRSLYIADWSYGLIYAVHLQPKGGSFIATREEFISAAPLPVTDMIVNPHDQAMYFAIGGRGTQSGLYRVTYVGDESTAPAKIPADADAPLRKLRRELEVKHRPGYTKSTLRDWTHLGHDDRHVRYAMRVALEHVPVAEWQDFALKEKNPIIAIQSLIALARNGDKSLQGEIVKALGRIDCSKLTTSQQLDLLRAYSLTFARMGNPDEATRGRALAALDGHYPAVDTRLNRELCQLLVYLEAPKVADRTMALLKTAPTQEEQIHYVMCLRVLKTGWTISQRNTYFQWFLDSASQRGGMSFGGFLRNFRQEAIATLSEKEKVTLKSILDKKPQSQTPVDRLQTRKFVKKWNVGELLPIVEKNGHGRDYKRGRELFAAANCFKCHRFAGEGGITGPVLTGVGRRFDSKVMLESLIEPSKVISDQYQGTTFALDNGTTVSGRIINLSGNSFRVLTDMYDPSKLAIINRNQIEEMLPSRNSMMPSGLLDTLSREEVLDLIAYLRSGGDAKHDVFSKK